jgi:HlyD family secretion protein
MNSKKPVRSKTPIWRSPWMWAAVLLILGGGAAGWFYWGKNALAQSTGTAQTTTRTATVSSGDLTLSASGSGTLQAGQSVDLSFSTKGTVAELNVKVGDTVKAGQVLASLSKSASLDANLSAAQLGLLQAKNAISDLQTNANVNLAQAYQNLLKAQTTYDSAVTAEQRTVGARCSSDVVGRYKEALDNATTKFDDLSTRDNGSQAWTIAKYDLATATANYNYCAAYTDTEKTSAKSTTAVAQATLKNAETTYNTLKTAAGVDPSALALAEVKLKNAENQVAKAQSELDGITLKAPLAGKIIYLAASKGAIVDTVKFITIADLSKPMIQVSVDEADMDKLAAGATAQVTFDALPEQVFSGTVTSVDPQLTTSGQYRVTKGYIALDDNAVKAVANLPLGLNATVNIISQEAKGVLLVPVGVLKSQGNAQYTVLLKGSTGQFTQTSVTIGLKDSTSAEITSGLKQGDVVSLGTISISSSSTTTTNGAVMPMDGGAGGPPPGP